MRKLGETEVKDILRHKEEKIEEIHVKMMGLLQELSWSEENDIITAAAMPSQGMHGLPGGGTAQKDLGDVLERYYGMRRQRSLAVREMMMALVEEEERISRVWACFYALGNPFFKILKALYVENQLYHAVEQELGMSHRTFEQRRREGIQRIIEYHDSPASLAELMRQHEINERLERKAMAEKKRRQPCTQINLLDFLDEDSAESKK